MTTTYCSTSTTVQDRISRAQLALLAAAILVVFLARTTHAECDPQALCPSGPTCTISGTHHLDEDCELDFGDLAIVIDPTAHFIGAAGDNLTIDAKSMVVQGELKAVGAWLEVTVKTEFRTEGAGTINVNQGGTALITAGTTMSLLGHAISGDGGGCLDFCVGARGEVLLNCSGSGPLTVQLSAGEMSANDGGEITLAAGSISISSNITDCWIRVDGA